MNAANGAEPLAVDHDVVPEAVQEDPQVPLDSGDQPPPQTPGSEPTRESSIYKLAQELLAETDRLAKSIKEDARRDAETEAARIRADAQAKVHEEVLKPAEAEAAAKSHDIITNAERAAQKIIAWAKAEAEEIVHTARRKAEELESEAEITLTRLTDSITEQIDAAVTNLSNLRPTALVSLASADKPDQVPDAPPDAPRSHPSESLSQTKNITPRLQGYDTDGPASMK